MKKNCKHVDYSDRVFIKSSFSPSAPNVRCVDVSIGENDVLVTNLAQKKCQVIKFSLDEWSAFIKGVKNNEFDVGKS